MMRRLLAGLGLAATLTFSGVAAANATGGGPPPPNPNQVEYWCAHGFKYEPVSTPFVVPAPPNGYSWTLLVLKAGNERTSVEVENETFSNPVVGQSYYRTDGKDISHAILCKAATTTTTGVSTTVATTTTAPTTTAPTTIATTTTICDPGNGRECETTTTSTTVATTTTAPTTTSPTTTQATTTTLVNCAPLCGGQNGSTSTVPTTTTTVAQTTTVVPSTTVATTVPESTTVPPTPVTTELPVTGAFPYRTAILGLSLVALGIAAFIFRWAFRTA